MGGGEGEDEWRGAEVTKEGDDERCCEKEANGAQKSREGAL